MGFWGGVELRIFFFWGGEGAWGETSRGLGIRGLGVQGLGFRVQGLGFRVWGLGFVGFRGVMGLGLLSVGSSVLDSVGFCLSAVILSGFLGVEIFRCVFGLRSYGP